MLKFLLYLTLFYALIIIGLTRMPSEYSDFYARHKIWPMAQIFSHLEFPGDYMASCFNKSEFYVYVKKPCDIIGNNTNITCGGALGVGYDEEAIILMFDSTHGEAEKFEENTFYNLTDAFPGGGTVHKFWYDGFLLLWNNGLRDAFFTAKNKNPEFELWVTGFSMGGSVASIAAAYISQMGYMAPNQVKLVTFGQSRVGHPDLANRYPSLVPYAYRVTHRNDSVPHYIPNPPYQHFKNEIWYNNNVNVGDPYIECDEPEGQNCSDSVPSHYWTGKDHWYFNGTGNCVKGSDS